MRKVSSADSPGWLSYRNRRDHARTGRQTRYSIASTTVMSVMRAAVASLRSPCANASERMLPSPGRSYFTGPAAMISLAMRKYQPLVQDRMLL